MKKIIYILSIAGILASCENKPKVSQTIQGKTEREEIAVVGKIAGRIDKILISEGALVKKGDTLAILEIPEVDAKKSQAQGAVKSAQAQYDMSVHGATANQLAQLYAKKSALVEQYEFAKKSLARMNAMVKDSLVPQQQYDEVFAKYQGAKSQMIAVDAEIADVKNGGPHRTANNGVGTKRPCSRSFGRSTGCRERKVYHCTTGYENRIDHIEAGGTGTTRIYAFQRFS